MGSSNCGLVKMYDSRRTSYSSSRSASTVSTSSMSSEAGSLRKQSLREMPSYRVEASKALNRRDDLKDLKKRLSSNRDLLNADHASKPWLKFRSISQKSFEDVKEESGQAYVVEEPNFDSAPKIQDFIFCFRSRGHSIPFSLHVRSASSLQ